MALEMRAVRPRAAQLGRVWCGSVTRQLWASGVVVLVTSGIACTGATDEKLPPTVQDPAALKTPSGAIARYRGALADLAWVFDSLQVMTGLVTDELASLPASVGISRSPYTEIDSRQDLSNVGLYRGLHRLRGQAREARGFIAAYAPDSSPALAGHLYALEAYADLFLADVFCSGIPLSTVDFGGDYTVAAGSSTAEVYERAITLFDSALAQVSDSVRVQHFAAVGRGRALLALGQYAAAAAAVAGVPDNYRYQVVRSVGSGFAGTSILQVFAGSPGAGGVSYVNSPATPGAADREGINGLNYRTSGDPRTAATARPGTDPNGNTYWFPNKYPLSGSVTFTVADGVEARLIEAEAALQAGDVTTWLSKLNHLRQTAISPALADTTDPGTAEGRVDLLFRERAFWLYLTGHRQGDLRRLAREYLRSPEVVYPVGTYPGGSGAYGTQIVAPVPASEQDLNTKYTGCLHLEA